MCPPAVSPLVRTISRFLRQARVPYSQDYMWATLRRHSAVAAQIVQLFHHRFDPRLELTKDALQGYDCILVATHHAAYDWQMIADNAKLIVDTRNALSRDQRRAWRYAASTATATTIAGIIMLLPPAAAAAPRSGWARPSVPAR